MAWSNINKKCLIIKKANNKANNKVNKRAYLKWLSLKQKSSMIKLKLIKV